jgi:hypothetical protein
MLLHLLTVKTRTLDLSFQGKCWNELHALVTWGVDVVAQLGAMSRRASVTHAPVS